MLVIGQFAIAVCVSLGFVHSALAAQEFPYAATVVTDDVEVRCGPGSRYYVTSKLNQGEQVRVHRHDHGGWFMIAPPTGSISLIDASLVRKTGSESGVVEVTPEEEMPARAIVRIGSLLSDDHSYYGRELSNGEQVQIVGERTYQTARGQVRMYQIKPPAQEFRWIKGEFVVPEAAHIREQLAHDPYQIPPEHRAHVAKSKAQQPLIVPVKTAEANQRSLDLQHLDEIDGAYAEMMSAEPAKWDLDRIQNEYETLRKTCDAGVGTLIQQRLDIIARRREILSHYKNFVRLANETSQRDANLAAMQSSYEVSNSPQGPVLNAPPVEPNSDTVAPRLNGAGIVQRLNSFPGMPAYGLVTPEGRLLAYLQVAGNVPLQDWVGKSAGVIGHRAYSPQLNSDLIRVQRILPVQLK